MLGALILLVPPPPPQDPVQEVEWDRDVRPILSDRCFPCHGPDGGARKAGLRLDRRESALEVLAPGDAAESELVRRILSEDPDERMPPPEADEDLTAEQKRILRAWVAGGAPYLDHWSFRPVGDPEPPEVPARFGDVDALDAFVIDRALEAGVEPSPEADRRTLIRRVTLDLTGLPPMPEEVEASLADDRPGAYERLVDRLLASDAHAERMTLAWMDAARYGDTSVYHADGPRDMWPWRDWVISAYRRNMPFDVFTTWQLAGDLLPDATREQLVASGFHRNNGTSDEGGAIDEELRVSYMVDRVKTTGNVWLGLTMECAQCHDHKYDPVDQRDYYRFYAYFDQADEKGFQTRTGNAQPRIPVPTTEQEARQAALARRIEELESGLEELRPPAEQLAEWSAERRDELLASAPPSLSTWRTLGPFEAVRSGVAHVRDWGPEKVVPPTDFRHREHEWVEHPGWEDGEVQDLGGKPSSATYLARVLTVERPTRQLVSLGSDDTIKVWLNGKVLLKKEVYRSAAADQEMLELPLEAGQNHLLLKIGNGGGPSAFYFDLRGSSLPPEVADALRVPEDARDPEQRARLVDHFRREVWPPGRALAVELDEARARREELEGEIVTTMVLRDREEPRQTYVLGRGQYDAPLEDQPVEPGVLADLLPLPEEAPSNRLGLSRWLTHPDHPLTARVTVNRYWAMLLGRGLVSTVMDFGSQGDYPSHPVLLDRLARDFVESDWDVRGVLRRIVTSRTYRQSSVRRPEYEGIDPENRLLARAPRFRLQGEFVRDQALAASGLLVEEVGGPGVKPYQPPGLWNEVSLDRNLRFERDTGRDLYRRSMYIYWKRSAPMPAMTIFDAPTREKCVVQRQRTNTPLQALVVMNDTGFVEAARRLARRMMRSGATFEERLDEGFLRLTARPADAHRRATIRPVYEETLAELQADPERAEALLAVGESPRDETLDACEHAAWTVVASLLLNLDETLTRE